MAAPNEPRAWQSEHARWLVGLVLLAVTMRVLSWLRTAAMFDDGPLFLSLAEAMARNDWSAALLHPFHPLYPLATWGMGSLLGSLEWGAVAVSVLSGGMAVVGLVSFLRSAFEPRVAYAGGALLAVHPFAVEFSADVQSDGLYMALFVVGLALLWRAVDRVHLGYALATGAVAGLAYLTRPEGLGLVAAGLMIGAVAARAGWTAPAGAGRWMAWVACLGLGLALTITPYLGALRAETGEWMLTQKKSVAQLVGLAEQSPHARGALIQMATLPRASDDDAEEPGSSAERLGAAASELYLASVSAMRFVVLVFLALGIWRCRGRPGLRALVIGTVVGLYGVLLLGLAYGAGYVSRRHALPPLLPLLGYAGVGILMVGGWVVAGFGRVLGQPGRVRPTLALAVGLALVAAVALPRDLRVKRPDRLAERRAAEWLKAQDERPGPVAAGRPRVAYYAGAAFVPLPSSPEGGMIGYLLGHGAKYVIVDEAKLEEHLGLEEARDSSLRLMHRETAAGRSAAVFEVLGADPGRDPR